MSHENVIVLHKFKGVTGERAANYLPVFKIVENRNTRTHPFTPNPDNRTMDSENILLLDKLYFIKLYGRLVTLPVLHICVH